MDTFTVPTVNKFRVSKVYGLMVVSLLLSREGIIPSLTPRSSSFASRNYYEAKFLSEFPKVRFATGGGRLVTVLENVAKLSPDQLPLISGKRNAPESWRRFAALHRESFRLGGKSTHFLAYRDAAKVFDGMSDQEAHATQALSSRSM